MLPCLYTGTKTVKKNIFCRINVHRKERVTYWRRTRKESSQRSVPCDTDNRNQTTFMLKLHREKIITFTVSQLIFLNISATEMWMGPVLVGFLPEFSPLFIKMVLLKPLLISAYYWCCRPTTFHSSFQDWRLFFIHSIYLVSNRVSFRIRTFCILTNMFAYVLYISCPVLNRVS